MPAKARFVSKWGAPSVGVQHAVHEHYGTGEHRTLKRRIDANFHNVLVTDDDLAVALASFTFNGLPFDEESNSIVSPRYRVSVWDSEWAQQNEGWTDDEIDLIVESLRKDSGFGPEFVEVTVAATAAPFPGYDDLSVEEIRQILFFTKHDPGPVVAYERENQNRLELIEALEGSTASDDSITVQA